jgi:hypothetical protein
MPPQKSQREPNGRSSQPADDALSGSSLRSCTVVELTATVPTAIAAAEV